MQSISEKESMDARDLQFNCILSSDKVFNSYMLSFVRDEINEKLSK